ncbi:hypothetical protein ACR1PO_03310 [Chryseobacterium sp. RRHN12]|uniref:hypothetical protein n=1 Tax=Chryseobacterium sp. RRHN12 TaxID=3437884 RepID=UPI003D9B35E8
MSELKTKRTLLLLTLGWYGLFNAQVAINNTNPQGIFHVDGAKDNPATGAPTAGQQANDFVVKADGKVGIGTTSPSTKLDINNGTSPGAVKITDGTQGLGKVLTSDTEGYARWASPSTSFAKLGNLPNTFLYVPTIDDPTIANDQRIAYSGGYIKLTKGKYQINFTMWCAPSGPNAIPGNTNSGFAAVFFSTSSTTNTAPTYLTPLKSVIIPRLYNTGSISPDYYGSGNIAVNITSDTTLYLWVYMDSANWSNITNSTILFRFDSGYYGPYVQLYAVPFETQ